MGAEGGFAFRIRHRNGSSVVDMVGGRGMDAWRKPKAVPLVVGSSRSIYGVFHLHMSYQCLTCIKFESRTLIPLLTFWRMRNNIQRIHEAIREALIQEQVDDRDEDTYGRRL